MFESKLHRRARLQMAKVCDLEHRMGLIAVELEAATRQLREDIGALVQSEPDACCGWVRHWAVNLGIRCPRCECGAGRIG